MGSSWGNPVVVDDSLVNANLDTIQTSPGANQQIVRSQYNEPELDQHARHDKSKHNHIHTYLQRIPEATSDSMSLGFPDNAYEKSPSTPEHALYGDADWPDTELDFFDPDFGFLNFLEDATLDDEL